MAHARTRRLPARRIAALGLVLVLGAGGCAPLLETVRQAAGPAEAAAPEADAYAQGKQHLAEGRFGLAVLHFRAALAESPESVEALNGLGAAFDRMGRFDLAQRAYGRALALAPQDAPSLNNLGYSFLLQGRYDLAVAYLREASLQLEADARILANRRLAETALARAGGPSRVAGAAGPAPAPAAPSKPRLVPAGKGLRHLVTRPPVREVTPPPIPLPPPRRPKFHADLLPGFVAAPMAPGARGMRAMGLKSVP